MASSKFSYQKRKKLTTSNFDQEEEEEEEEDEEEEEEEEEDQERSNYLKKNWLIRLQKRRPRVRISRSIGSLLRSKAWAMLRNAVRKVVRRLKEGRPYIGKIFAGNYMFMQVNPSYPSCSTRAPTVGPTSKPYLPAGGARFYCAAMVPPPLASSPSC